MAVKTLASFAVLAGAALASLVSCAGLHPANAGDATSTYAGRFLVVAHCEENGEKPSAAQLASAKACAYGWEMWADSPQMDAEPCAPLRPSNFTWMHTESVRSGTVHLRMHTPHGTTAGTALLGEEGRNRVAIKCGN